MKVFCLESDWSEHNLKDRLNIRPILQFTEEVLGPKEFSYIHRSIPTLDSFHFYMNKFIQRKYRDYDVLYLAMHGSKSELFVVNNERISLQEIAEEYAGKLSNTYVHFGSCSTLRVHADTLKFFKEKTGASYISGFTKDVDFIDSSILDMALFYQLSDLTRRGHVGKRIRDKYPGLSERLGFEFY